MENYVKVKQRIASLIQNENYRLETKIEHVGEKKSVYDKELTVPFVIVKATIYNTKTGEVVSTGHALEEHTPTDKINSFSYLENCETSAVGRAMEFIGITDNNKEIANKEEIAESKRKNDDASRKAKMRQGAELLKQAVEKGIKAQDKKEVKYYSEKDIPTIKPPTGRTGRLKDERESIINWLKKEGLDQRENDIVHAMVKSGVGGKYNKFSDMIKTADHSEFVEVFKYVEKK